ncbi:hypothetical protein K493DRAFT_312790 [Basidiobolus meristosporus CBS 931.73]|uniref:Uncharacterized protein n=1 Tax=Basidiobolus meristosporus CBS 931.73 TaxID=1314790 RepID=A0A1Y1YRB7_9FUNG|nr:hypothetical protein K493DRAFT_312790 [Basidiobolus meristosporus CBS 931.73]|eukprot:ORY00581.1 hypothetical protein K493DRAFT_312790 [Basidiobolus meristosporus CBS 931.73]
MSRQLLRFRNVGSLLTRQNGPISSVKNTRTLASQSDAHHEQHNFPVEDFSGGFWKGTLLVIGGIFAWSKLDESLLSKSEQHPITKFIERFMTPEEVWRDINQKELKLVADYVEDSFLLREDVRPKYRALRYPEMFERASPHFLVAGEQADLSDLVLKGHRY